MGLLNQAVARFFSRLWQRRRGSGDAAASSKNSDSDDEGKGSMPTLSKWKSLDESDQRRGSVPVVFIEGLKSQEEQKRKSPSPPLADQMTPGSPELYEATESFESQDPSELDLRTGEEYLVLEKSLTGWWYVVAQKTHKEGWVPGSFLQNVTADTGRSRALSLKSRGTTCILSQKYTSDAGTGQSLPAGTEVSVRETSDDGWWLVYYKDIFMKIPAALLLPVEQGKSKATDKAKLSGSQESIVSMINDIRRDCSFSKRRPPPPPKKSKTGLPVSSGPTYSEVKRPGKLSPKHERPMPPTHTDCNYEDIDLCKNQISASTSSKSKEDGASRNEMTHEDTTFATHSSIETQLEDVNTSIRPLNRNRRPAVSPRCKLTEAVTSENSVTKNADGLVYAEVDFSKAVLSQPHPAEPATEYTEVLPVSLPPLNIPPPKKHSQQPKTINQLMDEQPPTLPPRRYKQNQTKNQLAEKFVLSTQHTG